MVKFDAETDSTLSSGMCTNITYIKMSTRPSPSPSPVDIDCIYDHMAIL